MNPFLITNYIDGRFFCDREQETQDIIKALDSGRSVTLHAIRRIGKTGLIKHVFHALGDKKDISTIYIDVFDTNSDQECAQKLINAVINELKKSQSLEKQIIQTFARYRPRVSLDPFTHSPSIQIDIAKDDEVGPPIEVLFSMLKKWDKTVYIAIDEFQQTQKYPSSSIAATLREVMQTCNNVRFIFSGSQKNLLLDLFTSPKQALFRSTQLMSLEKLPQEVYEPFVAHHFKQGLKKIKTSQINGLLKWTCNHTYYSQYIFNRLYAEYHEELNDGIIENVKQQVIKENEVVFYNYRNLMTKHQWMLLEAIAKEEEIAEITAKNFLSSHNLGSHATVRRSIKFLLEHEFVYATHNPEIDKLVYHVYDPFLMRSIQNRYLNKY